MPGAGGLPLKYIYLRPPWAHSTPCFFRGLGGLSTGLSPGAIEGKEKTWFLCTRFLSERGQGTQTRGRKEETTTIHLLSTYCVPDPVSVPCLYTHSVLFDCHIDILKGSEMSGEISKVSQQAGRLGLEARSTPFSLSCAPSEDQVQVGPTVGAGAWEAA